MPAYHFPYRITIERPVAGTPTDSGEVPITWQKWQEVRADVVTISAGESFAARMVQSSATHKVNIRYLSGVSSAMRVKFRDVYMYIEGIADNPKLGTMELTCVENR